MAPLAKRETEGADDPAGAPRRASVLLVDDHAENLLALETVLTDLDLDLVKASSGREALRRLLERDFAAILLDVQMPEMDGFETARLIRERGRSRHTPIVFLTAFSKGEAQVYRGYMAGAVDYIFKPFVPEVLRAKVSVFVELFRKTETVREQADELRRVEGAEYRRELTLVRGQRNRFFYLSLDLMCIVGFDGKLREVNDPWTAALGRPRKSLLRRKLAGLAHPDDQEGLARFLRRLQAGEPGPASWEGRLRRADGQYRWLAWSATAFEKERLIYATARDVTDRRAGEEKLRLLNEELERRVAERTAELTRANAELRRSNAELEHFAFLASHDLREPLRKVASFAQLLQRGYGDSLDDAGREYLRHLVGGAMRMQALIADLLEYSRVGRGPRPAGAADCGRAAAKALENLSLSVAESEASVRCEPLPRVAGDETLLVSLFQNLLGNAMKFRGEARPEIRVSAVPEGKMWRFAVRDNGIGIDPAHHDRIFAVFRRLHTRDEYPGTGIGLAICKKIVERHGGRIWVESSPGAGSSFHFTLPAAGTAA